VGNTYNTLSKVRPLSRHLEVEPLLDEEFLGGAVEAQRVLGVVCLGEVFDDGTRLPQVDTGIWVLDGRNTSIDAEGLIWIFLQIPEI